MNPDPLVTIMGDKFLPKWDGIFFNCFKKFDAIMTKNEKTRVILDFWKDVPTVAHLDSIGKGWYTLIFFDAVLCASLEEKFHGTNLNGRHLNQHRILREAFGLDNPTKTITRVAVTDFDQDSISKSDIFLKGLACVHAIDFDNLEKALLEFTSNLARKKTVKKKYEDLTDVMSKDMKVLRLINSNVTNLSTLFALAEKLVIDEEADEKNNFAVRTSHKPQSRISKERGK